MPASFMNGKISSMEPTEIQEFSKQMKEAGEESLTQILACHLDPRRTCRPGHCSWASQPYRGGSLTGSFHGPVERVSSQKDSRG